MSSDFAAKVKHNNASFAVHRAQLKGTQALLANMRCRHVFPLMELPEEVRRLILIMLVRNQCNLGEFKYELPAIAWAGNEQLCSKTLLAALQNNVLDQTSDREMMPNWLIVDPRSDLKLPEDVFTWCQKECKRRYADGQDEPTAYDNACSESRSGEGVCARHHILFVARTR
jgi:hypothetical protein